MKRLIILIPGNPSVPGIYNPFLKDLSDKIATLCDTQYKILPHYGQCNLRKIKKKSINVHDVVEDHKTNIKKLITESNADHVTLIGHSLGSAVTILLYQEFKNKINDFIILCPFTGPSPNNTRYLKMFKNPVSRLGMKGITYSVLANKKVSHFAFKKWLGKNPFNEHIPKEIKKPRYLKNFFSLVSNYMKDFEELDVKYELHRMGPENTYFLFAKEDYWVPNAVISHLPKKTKYDILDDIQHDFCLFEDQYKKVSEKIFSHIKSNT